MCVRGGGPDHHHCASLAPSPRRTTTPQIDSPSLANFKFAGDFVDRGGHRSWSQEKALVTGYQAAKRSVEGLSTARLKRLLPLVPVPLDVEADEPHIRAGRKAAAFVRGLGQGQGQE